VDISYSGGTGLGSTDIGKVIDPVFTFDSDATELKTTSNLFLAGHGIRLEISARDRIQEIWYHLPHMDVVKHTIYCDESRPSYVLLPLIPKGYVGAGEPAYPPAGPFDLPKYERSKG
jgi:hypothetical protein